MIKDGLCHVVHPLDLLWTAKGVVSHAARHPPHDVWQAAPLQPGDLDVAHRLYSASHVELWRNSRTMFSAAGIKVYHFLSLDLIFFCQQQCRNPL